MPAWTFNPARIAAMCNMPLPDMRDMDKREAYAEACGTLNDVDLPNVRRLLQSLESLRGYVKALDDFADSDPRVIEATAILSAYRDIV